MRASLSPLTGMTFLRTFQFVIDVKLQSKVNEARNVEKACCSDLEEKKIMLNFTSFFFVVKAFLFSMRLVWAV